MGNLLEIYKDVLKDLKTRPDTPQYSTGIDVLDEAIWGLHKKELLTIGARPAQGKSSLALQIAFNLAESHKILFISLEMSKEQLVERLLNYTCTIDNYKTRRGILETIDWQRLESMADVMNNIELVIVDSLGAKKQEVEALVKSSKPDFVFFDFIQQLYVESIMTSKVMAIEDFVRKLKEISIKYNCGVVMMSQINRSPQDRRNKEPLLSDLKGSGAIEETSDTVLLCYWEWGDSKGRKGEPTDYKIIVAKQRHGAIQDISLKFESKYFKFY